MPRDRAAGRRRRPLLPVPARLMGSGVVLARLLHRALFSPPQRALTTWAASRVWVAWLLRACVRIPFPFLSYMSDHGSPPPGGTEPSPPPGDDAPDGLVTPGLGAGLQLGPAPWSEPSWKPKSTAARTGMAGLGGRTMLCCCRLPSRRCLSAWPTAMASRAPRGKWCAPIGQKWGSVLIAMATFPSS